MKICIWITKIFDLGGTKRVVSLLANELVKEHEVTIMTYEDRFREDRTMYHLSDALISDYSSVAIDYLLLNRPIGFTLDDYDAYTESRGWVFEDPLEYMPGEHIYNVQQFEQFVLDVKNGKDDYENQRKAILAKTHNVTDNYCKRVLDYFKITI